MPAKKTALHMLYAKNITGVEKMENMLPFEGEGKWFKGNLHCHSTVSDGKISPDEVVEIYKKRGWNFLAFTEHDTYSHWKKWDDENFITIPGVEASANNYSGFNYNHVLGIGISDEPDSINEAGRFHNGERLNEFAWEGWTTIQKTIDELNEKNNFSVVCHPIWSRTDFENLMKLRNYLALEIFNYGCHIESYSGLGTVYWDYLLQRGIKVWGIATDDAHHYLKDECGGWISVKAGELTPASIADSIIKGRFYASSGPEIYDFGMKDGEVFIETSEVSEIHAITYGKWSWGANFNAGDKGYLTKARYKLTGDEQYIRMECVDRNGRAAWTNPLFLK